jgi:hypothetical protein
MLKYNEMKDRPRDLLAVTGLTVEEIERLLPLFESAYRHAFPEHLTQMKKKRARRQGGGARGALPTFADKLFFILVYQKTNPLQAVQGLHFGLSQGQANEWIHRLLPILASALRDGGLSPSREGVGELGVEGGANAQIDGVERRRQRPVDATRQRTHYSGKKKTHTDKNIVVVNENTGKVAYLSPTVPGSRHDKRASEEAGIVYPINATLAKDTGFQGYEPAKVITHQPQKKRAARN